MDFDADDPILDAMLDEVLADRRPPDLAAQILRTWGTRQNTADAAAGHLSPSAAEFVPPKLDRTSPPVLAGLQRALEVPVIDPSSSPRASVRSGQRRGEPLSVALTVSLAAAVIGLGITIGLVALLRSGPSQVAVGPSSPPPKVALAPKALAPSAIVKAPELRATENKLPSVEEPEPQIVSPPQLAQQPPPDSAVKPVDEIRSSPPQSANNNAPSAVVASVPKVQSRNPSPDAQIVSFVNAELSRVWKDAGVKPTPTASDAEWCQRLFHRLLGRAPTSEELKSLSDDKANNRREKLVDRLLTQSSYTEEYAQHWSAVFTNVFLGKNGGRAGSLASREELQNYFSAALSANKPYSEIAQDLLIATGSPKAGAPDYNPAANFLLEGLDAYATTATARVARVMLGHQLQCAQCHTHPTQDWTQDQFWALNASLRQFRTERSGGVVRLANADASDSVDVVFQTPEGIAKAAAARFIDGSEISATEPVARRQELARLVADSDDFSKATVNRLWAQFFDYGFTRPVDDLGPHSSPAAPAVLNRLASEFAAHDYDLKRLIRWTVLTDSFARSSKLTDLASKDMPEEGEAALFSRFYDRSAQAAEVYGALVQAGRIRANATSRSEAEKARIDWLMNANRTPTKGGKVVVPSGSPAVMVQGSDLQHRPASGDPTGLVKKLAASQMPFAKQVEHLFMAALDRPPTPREQQAALQLSRSSRGNASAALEDIWWALQNSSECVLDR